jgi:hypothetical protein
MAEINWNELLEDPLAVEASPLERVVGVGMGQTRSGVTVELLAIEFRSLGWFVHLKTEFPTSFHRYIDTGAELDVSDDVGTHYSALPVGGSGSWYAHGLPMRQREQYLVVPGLARDAKRVRVVIPAFGGQTSLSSLISEGDISHTSTPETIKGPWEFTVEVGP